MMIFVLGRPDSGKSKRAEEIALERSKAGERIYLATMIPFGEEGKKRVEKHLKMRDGKGFITVECPVNLRALEKGSEMRSLMATESIGDGTEFRTLETGGNEPELMALAECEDKLDMDVCLCLLECVSNLVGNEMHENGREHWDNRRVAEYVVEEIKWLSEKVKDLVVVSNEFEIQDDFDEDTKRYVEICSLVNAELIRAADKVERICCY